MRKSTLWIIGLSAVAAIPWVAILFNGLSGSDNKTSDQAKSSAASIPTANVNPDKKSAQDQKDRSAITSQQKKEPSIYSSVGAGAVFYDPNRRLPYMANLTSAHATRQEAIAALASQFDRSTTWVETNMGNTNDLNEIHRNLSRALLGPMSESEKFGTAGVEEALRQEMKQKGLLKKPTESGYSLEARKSAAVRTLMDTGWSREDAEDSVNWMVEHDMLPDPARK